MAETNIGKLLKEKKIKQKNLALFLNVTPTTVNRYCKNSVEADHQTLIKIADFLNISLDTLLNRKRANKQISEEDTRKLKYYQDEINKILNKY